MATQFHRSNTVRRSRWWSCYLVHVQWIQAGQAARRPGGQPHFRLGQIFACNMYLASLKGVMKEAPQLVSVSVIDSLQLCMVHHGSSWFILVRFFVYPHRPYRPFSFAGECRSEQGETRTRRPADGGRSGGDMVQRFDVLIQYNIYII